MDAQPPPLVVWALNNCTAPANTVGRASRFCSPRRFPKPELHNQNIMHGDVKPSNVFIDHHASDGFTPIIGGFTFAATVTGDESAARPHDVWILQGPSVFYAAPEVLKSILSPIVQRSCSLSRDIYAYGIAALELMTRYPPWSQSGDEVVDLVLSGHHPAL